MSRRFYVTTPIYYVNDIPHIGHAYTTVAADILARRNRLIGNEVFFLTGTDEHGQKVEKAAFEKGRTPKEHADLLVENFKQIWRKLNVSNDAFIRTTDEAHIKTVQGLMQRLLDIGEIEKRSYSGWYCTPDERFWTEKDLVSGNCPDCGRPVEQIHEENYFFLMSKYQDRLIKHIEDHPSYILPETRRNEVLGFLRHNELGDLCISRPKQRLSWGISLPFDDNFVTYVWFDALVNYYSATTYLAPDNPPLPPLTKGGSEGGWWPATHHLVGKDILTTHAVYWSTMLMALSDIEKKNNPESTKFSLPENIFAHGWWTVDGKKMSKSLGNVVDPNAMVDKYGVDAFRYFLFREVTFGLDGDFSEAALINRINTDLANDLGNLLSRFLTMADKYLNGVISVPLVETSIAQSTKEHTDVCIASARSVLRTDNEHDLKYDTEADRIEDSMADVYWPSLRFNLILEHIWEIVRVSNNHVAKTEPWKLAKNNDVEAVKDVMYSLWNALRMTSILLYPFMPSTSENIWKQLGLKSLTEEVKQSWAKKSSDDKARYAGIFYWDWKPAYDIKIAKGEQLFPRIEKEKKMEDEKKEPVKAEKTEGDNLIPIADFAKVQLKTGKVLSAERVKKSDKLIVLQVDTGEKRQIVAGIGKTYNPEDLVGRNIVVVTNLQPAKLMGVESNGMLLAATGSDGIPVILMPEKDVDPGSKIK